MKNRLKRIERQVSGCSQHEPAIRSAVDKTIAAIVAENLALCIKEELDSGKDTDKIVEEAIMLLVNSR